MSGLEEARDATAPPGVRIALVGKGGVGKSTLSAMLARTIARAGFDVVAVDADEQRNLGATLGVDPNTMRTVVALAADGDYIEEKTGARPGEGSGVMLRLNPDTSDVVERLSVVAPDGVRLLVMGGVQRAGGGCLCPETALLAAAVSDMCLRDGQVVIMDTHAGVEHFGRALARGFDRAVVVVEPTFNSVQVGLDTARLARDLDIEAVDLVVNQCRGDLDADRLRSYVERLGGFDFTSVSTVPYDDAARRCEPSIGTLLDGSPLAQAVRELAATLVGLAIDGVEFRAALVDC